MEALVDVKYRLALFRHGGVADAKNKLGHPAAATAGGGAIESAAAGVYYFECLQNHAANDGGHVVDGCGEFLPAPAARGCHRSFHRRAIASHSAVVPPPRLLQDGWESESDYDDGRPMSPLPAQALARPFGCSLAPALTPGAPATCRPPVPAVQQGPFAVAPGASVRKPFRTKFSPEQKRRMRELSERLGWRLQKREDAAVEDCCREIGVTRGVFKVWMHNNKHNFVGGLHSARRAAASSASSARVVTGRLPAASVSVQPPFHSAAAAASAPVPPAVHAVLNIIGSVENYVVQLATASGGAPPSA